MRLDSAFLWDHVTVEDDVTIETALLDVGVHVYRNTTIQSGCVLASEVRATKTGYLGTSGYWVPL